MKRHLLLPALVLAGLLIALPGPYLAAQDPTPTPDPGCSPVVFEGPRTQALGDAIIEAPAGSYGLGIPPPGTAGLPFVLCHVETGALLTISGLDCSEISRAAETPEAEAIVEAILASCVVQPAQTPQTPPFLCPQGESVSGDRTVVIAQAIEVTLPPGSFVVALLDSAAQICSQDEEYMLALHFADCSRVDIRPPDDPHAAVADQIQASCVSLLDPADAAATPFVPDSQIVPPHTGDAGLLAEDEAAW